jgi:hypothetical protein
MLKPFVEYVSGESDGQGGGLPPRPWKLVV